MERLNLVRKFREFFGLPVKYNPANITLDKIDRNHNLLFEEVAEYVNACKTGEHAKVAKSIADLDILIKGLIIEHGFIHKWPRIFEEVMNSNMTKLNLFGQPCIDKNGRIDKSGPHYKKPNIEKILKDAKY